MAISIHATDHKAGSELRKDPSDEPPEFFPESKKPRRFPDRVFCQSLHVYWIPPSKSDPAHAP